MGRREADEVGDALRQWADARPPAASDQLARFMGPLVPLEARPTHSVWRRVAGAGIGVKVLVAAGLITATAAAAAVGAEHLAPSHTPKVPGPFASSQASPSGEGESDSRPSSIASRPDSDVTSPSRTVASESPEPSGNTDGESADASSTPAATEGDATDPADSSATSAPTDGSGDLNSPDSAQSLSAQTVSGDGTDASASTSN